MNNPTPAQLWPEVAPDWILKFPEWLETMCFKIYKCFIYGDRYNMYLNGLKNTLLLTLLALLLGIVLGVIVSLIRVSWDKNHTEMRGPAKWILGFFNAVCKVYLTVIRGTPAVVQLMIMYFVIFASSRNKIMVCALSFGINSGAYVAEIIRGGIMSVDIGQTEAGRSLGFGYVSTMRYIILPQAFKTVLPTLVNEFIVLLKETAVAGYVGLADVAYAGNIIGGNSYEYLWALLLTAIIYLVLVLFFTYLMGRLERRLRNSER